MLKTWNHNSQSSEGGNRSVQVESYQVLLGAGVRFPLSPHYMGMQGAMTDGSPSGSIPDCSTRGAGMAGKGSSPLISTYEHAGKQVAVQFGILPLDGLILVDNIQSQNLEWHRARFESSVLI